MSKTFRSHLLTLGTLTCALGGALAIGTASAATDSGTMADLRAQYEQDRAFCRSPENTQDLGNCMKEAAAAYDEAKWKARGRAESPRATLTPKPEALASGVGPTPSAEALGSGTEAAAPGSNGVTQRNDRR